MHVWTHCSRVDAWIIVLLEGQDCLRHHSSYHFNPFYAFISYALARSRLSLRPLTIFTRHAAYGTMLAVTVKTLEVSCKMLSRFRLRELPATYLPSYLRGRSLIKRRPSRRSHNFHSVESQLFCRAHCITGRFARPLLGFFCITGKYSWEKFWQWAWVFFSFVTLELVQAVWLTHLFWTLVPPNKFDSSSYRDWHFLTDLWFILILGMWHRTEHFRTWTVHLRQGYPQPPVLPMQLDQKMFYRILNS